MSPASKSKSKDKKSGKELTKASGKLAGSAIGSGVPLSAYNPLHGSFHALDLQTSSSASSIRFKNIDENEPNGNFVGLGGEFDAISNNGSWSGESEEHKDKVSNHSIRQESIPGTDNDKREKIRQKNERKHQRQKERRNLELREKCGGYLMSRKLEYLSQQLVAMGFSAERSTMALILNEGKVDQSVAWLIDDGAEEADRDIERINASGNLKIDISEELARIAELEIRYKCSRQDVERAVVACEGDIDKAAESIRSQKQEPPAAPPKREETGDPPTPGINGVKHPSLSTNQYTAKAPPKSNSPSMASRDEKDFNYTRTVAATLPVNSKPVVQAPQKRVPPQTEWTKSQQVVTPVGEKRWPGLVTNSHVTSPGVSPKPRNAAEVRYAVPGGEPRNTPQIGVREPLTVMQPHSSKPFVVTSIATSTHTTMPSWHPIGGMDFASNGVVSQIPNSGSFTSNNISPNQLYQHQQFIYPHQQQTFTANNPKDTMGHAKTNGTMSKPATSSAILTPASSLGLFPGTIAPSTPPGSSNHVDWLNGYEMRQIDYANIDWSLNRNTLPLSPSFGGGSLWSTNGIGLSSSPSLTPNGHHIAESRNGIAVSPRPGSSNGAGIGAATTTGVNMGAMNDWSSPFEENDIFNLPRQFASSQPMYDGHHHTGI